MTTKIIRNLILFTFVLGLSACRVKRRVDEVHLILPKDLKGKISGILTLGKKSEEKVFNVSGKMESYDDDNNLMVVDFETPVETKLLKYDLNWDLTHQVPDFRAYAYRVKFRGKIINKQKKVKVTSKSIKIGSGGLGNASLENFDFDQLKLKRYLGLHCTDMVRPSYRLEGERGIVELDISKFKSLDNCHTSAWNKRDHYLPHRLDEARPRFLNNNALNAQLTNKFASHQIFSENEETRIGDINALSLYYNNSKIIVPSSFTQSYFAGNRWARELGINVISRDFQANGIVNDLQRLMDQIASRADQLEAQIYGDKVRPKVYFINSDIVNAMAGPAGHVYIFRGLLDAARIKSPGVEYKSGERPPINIDAVASVLGHEWAHVVSRHSTEALSRAGLFLSLAQAGLGALGKAGKGKNAYMAAARQVAGQILVSIGLRHVMAGFGRQAEREADLLGAQYAARAGFNPWGIAKMFSKFKSMADGRGERGWLSTLFVPNSHPSHDERISQNLLYTSLFYTYQREQVDTSIVGTPTTWINPPEVELINPSEALGSSLLAAGKAFDAGDSESQLALAQRFQGSFVQQKMDFLFDRLYESVEGDFERLKAQVEKDRFASDSLVGANEPSQENEDRVSDEKDEESMFFK